jgi:hypothetical protein
MGRETSAAMQVEQWSTTVARRVRRDGSSRAAASQRCTFGGAFWSRVAPSGHINYPHARHAVNATARESKRNRRAAASGSAPARHTADDHLYAITRIKATQNAWLWRISFTRRGVNTR